MRPQAIGNVVRGAVLTLLALAVSACLITPGKFVSDLDIRKNGTFAFSYTGQIHMLALSKLAEMDNTSDAEFIPSPCYKDDSSDERPCTQKETDQQKQDWEEARKRSAERNKREAESMKAMFGGIDPTDPRAAEELALRLRRQAGWRKVDYKGNGLFEVDFAISGRLDHDFIFPTIERFPTANSFVTIMRREDGTVRIDAPAYGPASSGDSYQSLMLGAAASDKSGSEDLPVMDGRFTIRTDGTILANNTDEGPKSDPAGQKLDWLVNLRTAAAPTALIQLRR